ncbi:MAG TPA: aminoacyl-histidine dipeptidase [Longimicrobiales bacterium]|nr:aminoacyl-histidine dipeptidase [Longimicrobiales bacterium]
MSFVETLEPRALWQHFDRILTIPRGSREEAQMRLYVIEVAERAGLSHQVDAAGNVVVRKPGRKGREQAPVTILQSHLDMVNEKDSDVAHDFAKDPIRPRRDGEYLNATGTTLGSDNGIGVAAMLALLESDDIGHGPLELLFTIDEETGLTGASELDASLLEGRHLINLDSEEEGAVTVGCAGGAGSILSLPLPRSAARGGALAVRLRGLHGGHSGIDIHLQRGNAVKLLARMLHAAYVEQPFRLAGISGGNKHNAIPREALATVVLEDSDGAALRRTLEAEFAGIRGEYGAADPGMQLELADDEAREAWTAAGTATALRLIEALPHGVLAMSADIPGLVETSTNVATVAAEGDQLVIGTSSRSSVASALASVRRRIRAIAGLAGAEVAEGHGYPGWKPDLASPLLAVLRETHAAVLNREPEIKAVHAGLECGIIGEKIPGMDMISFGPQIEFPHSPQERVHIASVERFYTLLRATLERLAA